MQCFTDCGCLVVGGACQMIHDCKGRKHTHTHSYSSLERKLSCCLFVVLCLPFVVLLLLLLVS